MPRRSASTRTPTALVETDIYTPSADHPVRVRPIVVRADSQYVPHSHRWSQLAYCSSGIVDVTLLTPRSMVFVVPSSRAVWIPAGVQHTISVLETAQFHTLYVDDSVVREQWKDCRLLAVSALMRELILAFDCAALPPAREALLSGLLLDEIGRADTHGLSVPMPDPLTGDKRLRALCERILRAPSQRATLAQWAADIGASESTVARQFRDELGLNYKQWRQQVALAHALPLLARGASVRQVAQACGYASESAFTVVFKAALGTAPGHFQGRKKD